MADSAPINIEAVLLRTTLERAVFVDTLKVSLPYLAQRMGALSRAVETGDSKRMAAEAHAIKGSAASLGMEAVQEQALRLEQVAKNQRAGDARADFQRLDEHMSRAVTYALTVISPSTAGVV
jgi:HPt (histidine-containing phosphotransfer) domain-containing protein